VSEEERALINARFAGRKSGELANANQRIALLEKALRHYRFGPRGWAARLGLGGGDVLIDPETAAESAGGPFEWEAAGDAAQMAPGDIESNGGAK
jgi:hypothetical protein